MFFFLWCGKKELTQAQYVGGTPSFLLAQECSVFVCYTSNQLDKLNFMQCFSPFHLGLRQIPVTFLIAVVKGSIMYMQWYKVILEGIKTHYFSQIQKAEETQE